MKLLVTGCRGQVGTELLRRGDDIGHEVIGMAASDLDIVHADAVEAAIHAVRPDAVINAAAYTAVDKAESEVDAAFAVNRDGPVNLAQACKSFGIPLVHYSTDYVFDGGKRGAYVEDDPVAPLGVYGKSKLAGEEAVRAGCPKHMILRTSWVFSPHGHNFVKTMLRLGAEREELSIVADQCGKPTSAAEIARVTMAILSQSDVPWGTFHLAQPEVTTWHGFAEAIFAEANAQGLAMKVQRVRPITTADYPTPAKRPANSELNCDKLAAEFGIPIRPWRESLTEVIKELKGV
jgi:dTDP-4-dehydrorhamnose reductase